MYVLVCSLMAWYAQGVGCPSPGFEVGSIPQQQILCRHLAHVHRVALASNIFIWHCWHWHWCYLMLHSSTKEPASSAQSWCSVDTWEYCGTKFDINRHVRTHERKKQCSTLYSEALCYIWGFSTPGTTLYNICFLCSGISTPRRCQQKISPKTKLYKSCFLPNED